ncbi:putative nucleotidyltransferase substrate binding domain-containing protein [Deferribacter autotrophicus]|nr:putative nucleotidyltransferase substrate binding domain-containing protein [Deferribacter autotrophicus]
MPVDLVKFINNNNIFSDVSYEKVSKIISQSKILEFEEDEVLFFKGDKYHKGLYLIVSGEVIYMDNDKVILTLLEGDFVGLSAFLGKGSYLVNARVKKGSFLVFMPEICVYKLINESEQFREKFYYEVKQRLDILCDRTGEISFDKNYKPIGRYMTKDPISIEEDASVYDASRKMGKYKIGSVVVLNNKGEVSGILTAKNIVHHFLAKTDCDDLSVSNFMDKNVLKLPKEYPLVEAFIDMQLNNKEYIVIVENEKPVGIISNNDILKYLYQNLNILSINVENANNFDQLKDIYKNLYKIVEKLVDQTRLTSEVLPTLSMIHLEIQKRVYELTVQMFYSKKGINIEDIKHAFVIMGSGARKEMMLDPDQDNGFIFADDITLREKKIMMDFANDLVENLNYVGYRKCPGHVMIINERLSKTLSDWKTDIANIVNNPGNIGLMWSSIMFDMGCLAGDERLVWELKDFVVKVVKEKDIFLIQLLEKETHNRIPLSMFGRFIVEKKGEHKGEINLKTQALTFIVDVTRAFILKHGLFETNTIDRLKALKRKGILGEDMVLNVMNAYEILVDMILRSQIEKSKKMEQVNKYINPEKLSKYNQQRLKESLSIISKYLNTALKVFKGHP